MLFDFYNDKNKKIHFIGIGGISMSGLAEIMLKNNYIVSGSDMKSSTITDKLQSKGAKIYIGHDANNIKDVDLVVYTAAISQNNPELIKAKELNLLTMDRAEFLGAVMRGHKYNVAIAGTHGKTTTTSMISCITLKANLDPTILVGGELDIINGNVRAANSDYFISEACEYKASFLKFSPYIGTILNIDADHLDFYKDLDDITNSFLKFAKLIPEDGFLIACAEDKKIKEILPKINCNKITYGIKEGNLIAKNIKFNHNGCPSFDVIKDNEMLFSIKLNVPGTHNLLNALASIAIALSLNIDKKYIIEGLESFGGTHRRFEIKGVKNNITVIDDYAHHPTEIKATLNAAKNYPHKRIFCVFQPHTYSRTLSLFNEFSNSFSNVDKLILADIYAAREKDDHKISSDMLGDKIRSNNVDCINLHNFDSIVDYLKENLTPEDIILTIGAGDVYKIGELLLEQL